MIRHVRLEEAEDRAVVRARLVVDVDVVAARDVADEALGRAGVDRDGPLLPGELRRDCVGQPGAHVGRRDLLAGEDVRHRDAAVEVRRIRDGADLQVVLRERRGLEEPLLGDDRAGRALAIRPFATSTGVCSVDALTLERYWTR